MAKKFSRLRAVLSHPLVEAEVLVPKRYPSIEGVEVSVFAFRFAAEAGPRWQVDIHRRPFRDLKLRAPHEAQHPLTPLACDIFQHPLAADDTERKS